MEVNMSSSRNLVGTGLLSLLALVVFQNSALGDEDRTQERNGERPVVLDSNATPQWAPAAQRLVIQVPEESPRIVTVGEDERGTALVTAADEQAWTF
jgi:hypothetical protein